MGRNNLNSPRSDASPRHIPPPAVRCFGRGFPSFEINHMFGIATDQALDLKADILFETGTDPS